MTGKTSAIHRQKDMFSYGLAVVLLSIAISMIAFSGENGITGFAVQEEQNTISQKLPEFSYVGSLKTLAQGNYYVDGDGIVYWIDDPSNPAIAKVNFIDEDQKNRRIYIDKEGNVGYILK